MRYLVYAHSACAHGEDDAALTKFLQTLVDAIAVGSLYALVALGYTMVYGILQFINFAHASVFMFGAWLTYRIAHASGWASTPSTQPWLSALAVLLASMAICGVMGYLIERLAYRPLRDAPRLNVLITAIGVSLLLENAAQLDWMFGKDPAPRPDLFPAITLTTIAGVNIYLVDVIGVITALLLMLALDRLIYRSKFGLAMRASSFNHRTAALMGVPTNQVIALTFVLGSMLAAAAGFITCMKYATLQQPAHPAWTLLGVKAFVAAVVGGIGNIRGAMIGGLLIGLLEFFGMAYLSPHLRDVYVFTMLIVVLLVLPDGIMGKRVVEKV